MLKNWVFSIILKIFEFLVFISELSEILLTIFLNKVFLINKELFYPFEFISYNCANYNSIKKQESKIIELLFDYSILLIIITLNKFLLTLLGYIIFWILMFSNFNC
jgi:hypothetical protein